MRQALTFHPATPTSTTTEVAVEVARPEARSLILLYSVIGDIGSLRMPPMGPCARAEELWHHTCFEAFIGTSSDTAYYEFNFAPTAQWAAYWFRSYRTGMRVATEISAPCIETQPNPQHYKLQASLRLEELSALQSDISWRLGLSAVIEEASGCKSYWALAHPPGKPDFHHPDCFACELPGVHGS